MASSLVFSQENQSPKLIAVVNRANWCGICKANGQHFGEILGGYASKGLSIYVNDLTDGTTTEASKKTLQEAKIYDAITTIPRKGMGKMLKYCGLIHDKKQTNVVSGIVIFINPITHKQLKQESIAMADADMKSLIDNLLNN